jgi:hypothetical protein
MGPQNQTRQPQQLIDKEDKRGHDNGQPKRGPEFTQDIAVDQWHNDLLVRCPRWRDTSWSAGAIGLSACLIVFRRALYYNTLAEQR